MRCGLPYPRIYCWFPIHQGLILIKAKMVDIAFYLIIVTLLVKLQNTKVHIIWINMNKTFIRIKHKKWLCYTHGQHIKLKSNSGTTPQDYDDWLIDWFYYFYYTQVKYVYVFSFPACSFNNLPWVKTI